MIHWQGGYHILSNVYYFCRRDATAPLYDAHCTILLHLDLVPGRRLAGFANTTPPCWCIELNFCQKLHFYWHLSNTVVNLKHFIWTLSALPIESFQVSSNEPTLFSICERDLRGERRSKSGRLCICQKIGNPSPVLRPQLLELKTTLREAWRCLITYHPCIALAFHVV